MPVGLVTFGIKQALTLKSYNRVVPFAKSNHLNPYSLKVRMGVYIFVIHLLPLILHGLTLKGFLFAIVPIYLISLFFMICSQINHLTPHTVEQFSPNFFKH